MNENLENLRLKAGQLSLAELKSWDEIIAVWTELIEREEEPNAKAFAYLHRSTAYNYRGDHDLAIADIDEALKLAPSDPLMKIMGLFYRGCAHDDQGHHDKAIKDFTEALGPGLPHESMLALKAQIHFRRGLAYQSNDDCIQAFKDFVEADNCDPVLKTRIPPIYIAVQIADSHKVSGEEDGARIFVLYLNLLYAIVDIQKRQFYWPGESKEVAHYTSLHTLISLAEKGHFRLYNAAYMNDPEEGRVFFEIMNRWTDIDIDIEDSFYRDSKFHPSPAYIGSFVKVDTKDPKQKDELFLWRTYGKHDEQEAAGSCLIFKHEGTVFAEKCGAQIGAMQQLQAKLPMSKGDHQNPEEKQPRKPDLYKIVYSDENLSPLSDVDALRLSSKDYNSEEKAHRGLSEGLNKLAESLKQIKKHIEEEKDNGSKRKLKQLVRDLLDTIRFLFKARHYREEKEVRVVQVRYYDETKTAQKPDDIQVDTNQIPPRFYLKTHENFRFSEVILGPQARGVSEWKHWLKKRNIKADRSKIPYGKPYS